MNEYVAASFAALERDVQAPGDDVPYISVHARSTRPEIEAAIENMLEDEVDERD